MWDQQDQTTIWQLTHKLEGYTYNFTGTYAQLQAHLLAQALGQYELKRVQASEAPGA